MGSVTLIGNPALSAGLEPDHVVARGPAPGPPAPVTPASSADDTFDSTFSRESDGPLPWVTIPCLPAKTFLGQMYDTTTGLLDLYL